MAKNVGALLILGTLFVVAGAVAAPKAKVPGVRGGPAAAGGPLPGLTNAEMAFFQAGLAAFGEVEAVANGLGPRFNFDSCGGCHAQPATGGTSPLVNPQVAVATKEGAMNIVPSFITLNGPVREVRFKFKTDGKRDGGVHNLYTIGGRTDAPGCVLTQPDFKREAARENLQLLHRCFDTWRGIGDIVAGMARQEYDLELRRYDGQGWRAMFLP